MIFDREDVALGLPEHSYVLPQHGTLLGAAHPLGGQLCGLVCDDPVLRCRHSCVCVCVCVCVRACASSFLCRLSCVALRVCEYVCSRPWCVVVRVSRVSSFVCRRSCVVVQKLGSRRFGS